jgi:hypothetical protein
MMDLNEKINKDLFDTFRLLQGIINFNTYGIDKEIVPEKLKHNYLLKTFKIDEIIEKFYYLPMQNLISESELKRFENIGYLGQNYSCLEPYPIIFSGAYHNRKSFISKLKFASNNECKIENKLINSILDLKEYFEVYGNGFENGFLNFEEDCIKTFLILANDKEDYIYKIFEYITKSLILEAGWLNPKIGFTFSGFQGQISLDSAYFEGQNNGYYYKAWSIVFSNSNLFKNYFLSYFEHLKSQSATIKLITSKEVDKDLHNHIFKGNAFELFEKYHSSKSLAENSKTDLNLLFQLFQNDNLFVETLELKHYIKWLNNNYNYSLIELKKVNIYSKPNIQRTNDYNEYKKATLKQP